VFQFLYVGKQDSRKFFGNSKVSFVTIDGTESQDEHLITHNNHY
jgi:hypothetical protein